jgi:hypothetical protein
MTSIPKTIHIKAKMGLEAGIPIFFNPFSTALVISSPSYSTVQNTIAVRIWNLPQRKWGCCARINNLLFCQSVQARRISSARVSEREKGIRLVEPSSGLLCT